jgi:hypothetical protein
MASSSSLVSLPAIHTVITVNDDEDLRNKIADLGIDTSIGENIFLDAARAAGEYMFDYGAGVVVLKLGPGSVRYYWTDPKREYKVSRLCGRYYLFCYRLNNEPQSLLVVGAYDNQDVADKAAYVKRIFYEADPGTFNHGHGRPCSVTFDYPGAAYKRINLSKPIEDIIYEAEGEVPKATFNYNQ